MRAARERAGGAQTRIECRGTLRSPRPVEDERGARGAPSHTWKRTRPRPDRDRLMGGDSPPPVPRVGGRGVGRRPRVGRRGHLHPPHGDRIPVAAGSGGRGGRLGPTEASPSGYDTVHHASVPAVGAEQLRAPSFGCANFVFDALKPNSPVRSFPCRIVRDAFEELVATDLDAIRLDRDAVRPRCHSRE